MSEQPTREQIEEALNGDERKLEDWDTLSWAARQYLASLDVPAPSDCHVYKNIYGFWCFACSFKTEQDANVMLAKYASAPSDAVTVGGHHSESGSPKDGTREALLEENARLRTMADGVLAPHRLTRIEKLEAAEMRVKELEALQDKRADKSPNPMTRSAREALEEMFDGDIQQADRILSRLAEEGFVVVPSAPSAREEKLEEALERIEQWSRAYPLDIFPEPDWKKARLLLEEGGMTLDSISAHCMRYVVEGVGKIAQEALWPGLRIVDEMDPRHVSNPGTGAHVLDHRSPPVPQEGVSGIKADTELKFGYAGYATLLEENARLRARVKELEDLLKQRKTPSPSR